MDSNDKDMGKLMGDAGYYVPRPSVPKSGIGVIPIPRGMTPPSAVNNDMLAREEESDIPSLADSIRNSVELSYHDERRAVDPALQMANETGIPRGRFDTTGRKISLQDSRYRLSDGTWIPKYESYVNGVDNEDRLARSQSSWEKFVRGIGKLGYKTALYGIGGVAQSVYGMKELVTKGSLTAMYDNEFTRWLDDIDRKGDYTLTHYYKQEERDAGFLKSLRTSNFWFNDLLSGLAFTTGAMLSSYVFSGMGLMSLSRVGARAGATLAGMGKASSAARNNIGRLLRGARLGRGVGKAMDTLTFGATSTFWEAGTEARSHLMELEDNYKRSYRNTYGREPSYEELMRFRSDNIDAANAVFGANVGILSLSNIAMFGDMFNIDFGVDRFVKKNVFGIGAERMADGTLKVIEPGMWRKVAGNTFNILKRPVSEGLYEEGLQGVAGKTAENWIESRYNPMSIRRNMDFLSSVMNGFKETYGTGEGWKEIGIGMIIGSLMAGSSIGGVREWSQDRQRLKEQVEGYNENNMRLTSASVNAIRGAMALDSQMSGMIPASDKDGKRVVNTDFSDAVFARLRYDAELGLLDNTKENFRATIESIPNSEIAADMGVTESQVGRYKENLIKEFERKVDNFTKANSLADALTDGLSNRTFNAYLSNMAYNGMEARSNMRVIAERLDLLYGAGIGQALEAYANINPYAYDPLREIQELNEEIGRLQSEIMRTQQRLSSDEQAESEKVRLTRLNEELVKKSEDLADRQRRLATLANVNIDLDSLFLYPRDNMVSASDLMSAYRTITDFESAVAMLGADNYKEVMGLLDEYKNNLVAYKNISESMSRMRDKRFVRAQERGFMKLLSGLWSKTYEEDRQRYEFRDTENPTAEALGLYANDQAIDQAFKEGLISEDESFMFKTYNHMIARAMDDTAGDQTVVERVPEIDVVYPTQERLEDIASKIINGNEGILSPNERIIYDNNKDTVDDIVKSQGDSPLERLRKVSGFIDNLQYSSDPLDHADKAIEMIVDVDMNDLGKDTVLDAIDEYKDLANDRDNGKPFDADKLREATLIIENYSDQPLLELVEWERMLENGPISVGSYTDVRMEDVYTESEPQPAGNRSEDRMAQNPVVLMAAKRENNGVVFFEVGGLRFDRMIGDNPGLSVVMSTDLHDGQILHEVSTKDGDTLFVTESEDHMRWGVAESQTDAFERATGIILGRQTGLTTSNWFVVYRKGSDGAIIPYYTDNRFGPGRESIDQQALRELSKNDTVRFVMDMSDPYTVGLYDRWRTSVDNNASQEEIDKAYDAMVDGMVIKILDKDGRFVSVVKAGVKGQFADLRSAAAKIYVDHAGETGQVDIPYKGIVTSVLPGRPNFAISDDGDDLLVREMDVDSNMMSRIASVGYIEDGKVVTRDKVKYSTFPFCTNVIRDKKGEYKGKRIPVVVIDTGNGKNYLYPVRLKGEGTVSETFDIRELGERIKDALRGNAPLDIKTLMDLNNAIARSGMDIIKYAVPLIGDTGVIERRIDRVLGAASTTPALVDVRSWIGGNRSKEDILSNDVTINIDLNNDPFIAPKFRMRLEKDGQGNYVNESMFGNDLDLSFPAPSANTTVVEEGNVRSGEIQVEEPC